VVPNEKQVRTGLKQIPVAGEQVDVLDGLLEILLAMDTPSAAMANLIRGNVALVREGIVATWDRTPTPNP
jgi:hypothetical protein